METVLFGNLAVPGWIEPLPLSCSSAVTEEVSRGQRTSSYAGQHHYRVTARHHAGERVGHGYLVGVIT